MNSVEKPRILLTVTAKGQVTLAREVLDHLGIRPGDKVEATIGDGGTVILAGAPTDMDGDLDAFFGALHRHGRAAVSIERMNEVIADAWSGRR